MSAIASMSALWGILFLIEVFVEPITSKLFFKNLQYIPMTAVPALFVLFTVEALPLRVRKELLGLLAIDPILINIVVWTDPLTHWFRQGVSLQVIESSHTILASSYAWGFWVHILYVELVCLACLIIWGKAFFTFPRWNRGLPGTMFFGTLIPWAATLLTVPKWLDHSTDLVFLVAMIVSLVLLSIGILQHRVLDVLPIAQDALSAQMLDAVLVIDLQGRIASCNTAARMLPGLENIDPVGVALSTLGSGWQLVEDVCNQPTNCKKIISLGSEPAVLIYDVRFSVLADRSHPSVGMLLLFREITQEVNAARHHIETEERYRAIFENANDAILLEDGSENIIEVNQKACQLTGYSCEELCKMRTTDLQPEEHRNNPRLQSYESPSSEPCSAVEIDLLHKDGTRIPVELTLTPFLAGDRQLFLSIVRDIRERKQAEMTTRNALEDAKARVNELAMLRQLVESFNQAADIPSAVRNGLKAIHQVTGIDPLWAFLDDPDSDQVSVMVYDSAKEDLLPLIRYSAPQGTAKCLSALHSENVTWPSRFEDCGCSAHFTEKGYPVNSHWSLLLGVEKKAFGLINVVVSENGVEGRETKFHLVQTICNSLSITIERLRLFDQERIRRERAETLQNIGATLSAVLGFEDVLDLLLTQLQRLVSYDAGNVMVIEGTRVRILRHRGYEKFDPAVAQKIATLQFDIHLTENLRTVREKRQSMIIGDTSLEKNWIPTDPSIPFRAWLGGPVIIQDQVAYLFSLENIHPNSFTNEDAERLTAFTVRAALSIQNSKLFEAEKKRGRELQELQATLRDISSELDLNQLLKKIVDRAIALTGASIGELGLYDRRTEELEIVVSTNLDKDYTGNRIKLGEGVMGRVAKDLQPFIISNYKIWDQQLMEYSGLRPQTGLAVPMLAGGDLIGVLGVGDYNTSRKFGEEDIRLLELFAQQATVAIRNARLYKDARRRAEEAETLRQAGSVIVSTLHQEESLDRILEQLASVVPYDSASVALLREGELEIVGGHGFKNPQEIMGMRFELNRDHPGSVVFMDRKSMILKDAPSQFTEFHTIPVPIHSWLGVPLIFKEKTIGILSLDAQKPDQFTEEHAHLVQAFADQVSISLENARLYEQAVKTATRQEIIYRLTQEINANLREDQVCTAIHRATSSLMPTECFVISMLDERAHEIMDLYLVDRGAPQPLNRRPASQGLFAKVIADGKARKFDTFDQQLIVKTGAILLGEEIDDTITQSILCVPLKLGNKVKGVLSAQSYQPNQYSQEDLETLELLAANGMIALENSRLFGEVQQLAITDPLTQVFNRRRFYDLTELEFERSQRYGRPLSVIMLDIDHFKKVNDNFGHLVGDQVLQRLAEICSSNLRQIDLLARYGGEEFVILLPETNAAEANISAERLRHEVAREPFSTMRGLISITISLGVVELDSTCKSTEELLDRSDQALYHSKHTGRNRTTIWSPAFSRGSNSGGHSVSNPVK